MYKTKRKYWSPKLLAPYCEAKSEIHYGHKSYKKDLNLLHFKHKLYFILMTFNDPQGSFCFENKYSEP